jgi:xylose dehydrogenase (NAD/NADP)
MAIEPVRFGVLGCGRIARNAFAPAVAASPLAVLHAAASRDISRAEALKPTKAYGSYQQLLDDPAVEAVYIGTHNGLHCELAVAALERGKHVLCEKPLACTVAECEQMVAAARAADRHLTEAFMYRHAQRFQRAVKLVADGAVGPLRYVQAAFSFVLEKKDDVRWKREWGGGGLYDVGCYCVNACRAFLGDGPVQVQATGRLHPEHHVDVAAHATLTFPEERFAVISCGFDSAFHTHLSVVGETGVLSVPEPFGPVTDAGKELRVRGRGEDLVERFEPQNVFQLEVEDLARAVRGAGFPLLRREDGLRNVAVLEAIASQIGGGD